VRDTNAEANVVPEPTPFLGQCSYGPTHFERHHEAPRQCVYACARTRIPACDYGRGLCAYLCQPLGLSPHEAAS
jgi:hypothetical protein